MIICSKKFWYKSQSFANTSNLKPTVGSVEILRSFLNVIILYFGCFTCRCPTCWVIALGSGFRGRGGGAEAQVFDPLPTQRVPPLY